MELHLFLKPDPPASVVFPMTQVAKRWRELADANQVKNHAEGANSGANSGAEKSHEGLLVPPGDAGKCREDELRGQPGRGIMFGGIRRHRRS